jgi:glycosyltransferase involved in cell wall biosynthesis
MRVLTISNLYPPHAYGGYELSCRDVMRQFEDAGDEVHVLTSTARLPGVKEEIEPHVRRTLHPYWDWEQHVPTVPRRRARYARARANHAELQRALDEVTPDVVSIWHLGGLDVTLTAAVRRRGIPQVITMQDEWLVYGPGLDPWARLFDRPLLRRLSQVGGVPTRLDLADSLITFCSSCTRDRTRSAGVALPGRVEVLPLGVDLRDFPRNIGTPSRGWRLLYVGRIDGVKGIETLLRALPLLPVETNLQVIGGGNASYRRRLLQLCSELGIEDRVAFGSVPRNQLAAIYDAADIVVFPSEWPEPFGLVPLEAMARGRPLVATGTGGSAEYLVDGENCVLFRPGDAVALAAAVRRVNSEEQLRAQIVTGGIATAGRLTIDRYALRQLELHRSLVRSGG